MKKIAWEIDEKSVEAAAAVLASNIDIPKLPAQYWMELAREVIAAALSAQFED
jgi:hypothetical protein